MANFCLSVMVTVIVVIGMKKVDGVVVYMDQNLQERRATDETFANLVQHGLVQQVRVEKDGGRYWVPIEQYIEENDLQIHIQFNGAFQPTPVSPPTLCAPAMVQMRNGNPVIPATSGWVPSKQSTICINPGQVHITQVAQAPVFGGAACIPGTVSATVTVNNLRGGASATISELGTKMNQRINLRVCADHDEITYDDDEIVHQARTFHNGVTTQHVARKA